VWCSPRVSRAVIDAGTARCSVVWVVSNEPMAEGPRDDEHEEGACGGEHKGGGQGLCMPAPLALRNYQRARLSSSRTGVVALREPSVMITLPSSALTENGLETTEFNACASWWASLSAASRQTMSFTDRDMRSESCRSSPPGRFQR